MSRQRVSDKQDITKVKTQGPNPYKLNVQLEIKGMKTATKREEKLQNPNAASLFLVL